MRTITAWFAAILIALGVILFVATGMEQVTALIPAFIGVGFAICALIATTEQRRKHAMHGAVVLAILGFSGSVGGLPELFQLLAGETIKRPEAAWGRSIMAVLCVIFIVLAVRSFIQARRAREASANA